MNNVLNKLYGFRGIEEYFEVVGVIPFNTVEVDYITGKVKLREDVPEHAVVQNFIVEIAGGISVWYELGAPSECETVECGVFEEIAKQLSSKPLQNYAL